MTETELPEGSQLQLVSLTTSTVTAQLEQLAAVSGDTDQQRRQQLLLAMLPVIQSATDQRERLRSSRPSGATDTVYRVRGRY